MRELGSLSKGKTVHRFGKYALRDLAGRALELVRHTMAIILLGATVAFVEPYLTRLPTVAPSLGRPAWDTLLDLLEAVPLAVGPILLILWIIKSGILCWFTAKSFQVRNSVTYTGTSLLDYAFRFAGFATVPYAVFVAIGFATIWLCSTLVSPASLIGEKIVIAGVGISLLPVFMATISFTLYWSYSKYTGRMVAKAVILSMYEHAPVTYRFYFWRTIVDLVVWFVLPMIILSSALPSFVKIVTVTIVLSFAIFWLRGIGFEFNNSMFWDESERRFKY